MTSLEKITWSFQAQVTGGPSIYITNTVEMDAYEKLEVVIPGGGAATKVNVQPEDNTKFLLITASSYKNISYSVATETTDIKLDGPHILIGEGAVSLLIQTPTYLTFTNTDAADNKVNILLGREA
jgi:hypothetical protein